MGLIIVDFKKKKKKKKKKKVDYGHKTVEIVQDANLRPNHGKWKNKPHNGGWAMAIGINYIKEKKK